MRRQRHNSGYWTLEKVIEESKQFKTKGDFKKCSSTAYKIACQKGIISTMYWLKEDRHKEQGPRKTHKYTIDVIAGIIEQYNCSTSTDLRKVNEYAYKVAKTNNWLMELGLISKKHENGYWTEKRVWSIAKKYSNKNEFCKNEPVAYKWASYYGILNRMFWMKSPTYEERREKHDSEVYAFIDEENKTVYVGLTIDTKNRIRSHKYQKNSAVKRYFGNIFPKPVVLKTQLTIDESAYWEDYYKNMYLGEGYNVLNIAPTGMSVGSIGGISKWSSKESVFEESRKYNSRSEFKRKAGGAYNHALSNGWLDEMIWLQTPRKIIKWTREKVFEESHKYQYKGEFCNGSPFAYKVAQDNGWLGEMTWIKEKRKPSNYWTKTRVFEESHKYNNKKEFEEKAKTAYILALKNKWLKEMIWLKTMSMGHVSQWTRSRIIEESRKYTSKTEFAIKSPTAYQHAIKDKTIFFEMPWLIEKKKPNGWWNDKKRVIEEGKKYNTKTSFANASYSAWKSAKRNGWLEEMTWLKTNK